LRALALNPILPSPSPRFIKVVAENVQLLQ